MQSDQSSPTNDSASERLLSTFVDATVDAWRQAAAQELKGAPLSSIVRRLDEGVEVQPIGWPTDLDGIPFLDSVPGQAPFLRGSHASIPADGAWLVTARIAPQPANEMAAQVQAALAHGATALDLGPAAPGELAAILRDVVPSAVSLFIRSRPGELITTADELAALADDPALLRGAIMFDPVAQIASGGQASLETASHELAELARWADHGAPHMATISVDASIYHEAGGTAVEELAYALAGAVEQTRALLADGIALRTSVPRVRFVFAVGQRVLVEIAKLRAARVVWARAAAAFGAAANDRRASIHATGARRDKTRYDAHSNLVRGAVATFAAVLAGCDSIETARFDSASDQPDPMAFRLALNTHHLLRDEAHVGSVLDPVGGAYTIEALTDALARRAWSLFQEIESHGGMITALWGGVPQERLAGLASQRASSIAYRRRVLVGTNRYASADERLPPRPPPADAPHEDALHPRRDAEAFEQVRDRVAALSAPLRAFLANVGAREQYRARADGVADLLQAGGMLVIDSPGFGDANAAAQAAIEAGAQIVVIIAADAEYPALAPVIVERVRANRPATVFALAGYPDESVDSLRAAGVEVFLHRHGDALEALTTLVERSQGGAHADTA